MNQEKAAYAIAQLGRANSAVLDGQSPLAGFVFGFMAALEAAHLMPEYAMALRDVFEDKATGGDDAAFRAWAAQYPVEV